MATTFSPEHRAQLNAAGLTDQHMQAVAAAGVDPAKFTAAVPQLRQQAAALGIDWNRFLQNLPQLIALIMSFWGSTPAPGPVVPAVQT